MPTDYNHPLFSILIANYNNGKYLNECIESVIAQPYTNWEIIIIDDASTDEISFQVYNKYSNHNQIRIFYNPINKGCGFSKKRCLEEAKGDLCAFLDPDDAITEDAIEIMVKEHKVNQNHSIIYSTHYVCDQNLSIKKISGYPSTLSGQDYFTSKEGHISHFASFALEKYKQTEGLSEKYRRAIDHDLYFKLEETGPSKFIARPLYYYRFHNNSLSLNDNWWRAKYWDFQIMFDTQKRREEKGYPVNRTKESLIKDYDNYFYLTIQFFIAKRKYKKAFRFFCISMKYTTCKTLLQKCLLIGKIPFKILLQRKLK